MSITKKFSLFLATIVAMVALASSALADDWTTTGWGVRVKTIAFIDVKVYSISHQMKGTLPAKNKQAIIDADQDKRFLWQFLRDVPCEKIQKAMRDGFALNGFGDQGKINQFVGACNGGEVKEKSSVSISYNAANKTTTVWIQGMGSATIGGVDFMKAVWSLWFGKIDQPRLGDDLMSKMH